MLYMHIMYGTFRKIKQMFNKQNQFTVLMTALVPTIGHENLIKFAIDVAKQYKDSFVKVIVSSRSFEPVPGEERVKALTKAFSFPNNANIRIIHHQDDNAPQNPVTDEEWSYWTNLISPAPKDYNHYIVGSEAYCKELARLLEGTFIPYDMDRTIIDCKGTTVRTFEEYSKVMDTFKPYFQRRITLFGQESVGKTTHMKRLKGLFNDVGAFLPEFARPYLEYEDSPEVSLKKMENIYKGQFALQNSVPISNQVIVQDTDLLSTIGYYRLWNKNSDNKNEWHENVFPDIYTKFKKTKSDLYIVMNDDIPFEPDPLRYGGNKRETTRQYWIDLLEEFDCKYYLVKSNTIRDIAIEISDIMWHTLSEPWQKIKSFVRD